MSKRLSYWEMLRDPRWQEKRLRIMEREKFRCENCEDKTTTLNVHHSYYEKGLAPWEYPEESLHCLCEPCHKDAEDVRKNLNRQIGKLNTSTIMQVIGYAKALQLRSDRRMRHDARHPIELMGIMSLFLLREETWPQYAMSAREVIDERGTVSAHDLECAIQDADICMELVEGIAFVRESRP